MESPFKLTNSSPSDITTISAALRLRQVLRRLGRIYLEPQAEEVSFANTLSDLVPDYLKQTHDWCSLMEAYLSVESSIAPSTNSSNKTRGLFRFYLDRLGLNVSPHFTDAITEGDVVEVFGTDGKRVFFNPELFEYSSYPPDVMFSAPFWALYHREESISNLVLENAVRIFSGQVNAPFDPHIPTHIVSEAHSLYRYSSRVEIKLLAPVYLGKGLVGAVALERLKLISS